MAFYFSRTLRVFAETSSFVIARLIPTLYFSLFSVVLWLAFILIPIFFELSYPFPEFFFVLGVFAFIFYWSFFRKRIIYILKSSESVVVSEFIFGRNIPITRQASFGFNLIKKKFSSFDNFREFEKTSVNAIKDFYGVLGFVSFIPNVNSAIFSSVLSYVFADASVDSYTSLRDGLTLFYQKKNSILFNVFAIQMFSYIVFILSYSVLFFLFNPFISFFPSSFFMLFFVLLFLLLLVLYSSFVSHFLICWQSVFFIESVKNDVPSKNTRTLLEDFSLSFNKISSKAKVFVPLKSLSSRKLVSSFSSGKTKAGFLSSLDAAITDKATFENERKGEEALSELVSKVTEIKMKPKKDEMKRRQKMEKQKIFVKSEEDKEYNLIFDSLLAFLADELGTKNKFETTSLKRKGKEWHAIVLINNEPFNFRLDSIGRVIDFKEKK